VSAPLGLVEDLELERHAALELEARAGVLWAAGGLHARRAALELRADAADARAHVLELERRLAD